MGRPALVTGYLSSALIVVEGGQDRGRVALAPGQGVVDGRGGQPPLAATRFWQAVEPTNSTQGGAAAMSALLAQAEPPTAVLVANVASAVGALHTAYTLGLSVPQDVSVIAIHDMPLAGHLVPALTTVRMPLSELGRRAIELLAATSPDDDITETVTEPVEVIVRQSTGPPPERA